MTQLAKYSHYNLSYRSRHQKLHVHAVTDIDPPTISLNWIFVRDFLSRTILQIDPTT